MKDDLFRVGEAWKRLRGKSRGPSMQWLGDLPNAGYSTTREKALSDAVMFSIRDWERDRPVLLMMVIEGEDKFLERCRKAWAAWRVDDDLIRRVFAYVKLLAGPDPQGQLGQLMRIRPWGSSLSPDQIKAINKAAGLE